MKIAITGGTGFIGRNIARKLDSEGHSLVLVSRGQNPADEKIRRLSRTTIHTIGLENWERLANTFAGCTAVVHCAGINREVGNQTYERVHVEGTRNVVRAAQHAGVQKIVLISFLRARPDCGSGYHESKWTAEELVRSSGLDYTVLKCGVIYGKGDHMLDHLSHAFHTFPVFAFVGLEDKLIRPTAVADLVKIVHCTLFEGKLSQKTVPVVGPEELLLRGAVRRVAAVVGRTPVMFPMPVWFHYVFGWCVERCMKVPLVSVAQVRILSEGIVTPLPVCDPMPRELAPRIRFQEENIKPGLPVAGPFTLKDLHCCRRMHAYSIRTT